MQQLNASMHTQTEEEDYVTALKRKDDFIAVCNLII